MTRHVAYGTLLEHFCIIIDNLSKSSIAKLHIVYKLVGDRVNRKSPIEPECFWQEQTVNALTNIFEYNKQTKPVFKMNN